MSPFLMMMGCRDGTPDLVDPALENFFRGLRRLLKRDSFDERLFWRKPVFGEAKGLGAAPGGLNERFHAYQENGMIVTIKGFSGGDQLARAVVIFTLLDYFLD